MTGTGTDDVLAGLLGGEELSPAGELVARQLSSRLGFVKAANGDAMIAWYPPAELATQLAVPDGESPEDLHLTIVYLPERLQADVEVVKAVTLLCTQWEATLSGVISGTGRFVLDGDQDAFFATVDIPNLERFRERLIEKLECAGIWLDPAHGFTPHITLQYLPRTDPSPGQLWQEVPIEITDLTVSERDGMRWTYDLWDWDEVAEDSKESVAMATRPEDPQAAARWDRSVKAGMQACPDCGAPMTKKSGGMTCLECGDDGEVDAQKAAPLKFEYARIPEQDEVVKDADGREWQYTLGPLYAPDLTDAHDEFATDDDLHRAVIQYSLKNDRRLKLQHDTSREVGTWVELMRWPYDHTITLTKPGEEPREVALPAGTVYMGVLWDDDAWAAVKDGTLGGLSLGGRAVRVTSGDNTSAS